MTDQDWNLHLAQISWGWITPGTTEHLREKQEEGFLRFWKEWSHHPDCRFAFTHCGWYLDLDAAPEIRALTTGNPEPFRAARPADPRIIGLFREALEEKRLELLIYPYAACVAGATDGEVLFRSLRFSREAASRALRCNPRGVINHDAAYGLNWGAEQMPQIARLLGFDYLVSGKTGALKALDGSLLRTIGCDLNLLGLVRTIRRDSGIHLVILEMHDHLSFLGGMLAGTHPLLRMQPLKLRSESLGEFLSDGKEGKSPLPAGDLGNKGWFGGLIDAVAIEQHVYKAQRMLLSLETLQNLHGAAVFKPGELDSLLKQSLILLDNHILWQCHDYKCHYLPKAKELADHVSGLARKWAGEEATSACRLFNPVSWKRDAVTWDDDGAVSFATGMHGWAAAGASPLPPVRKTPGARRVRLSAGRVDYVLDDRGQLLSASAPAKKKRSAEAVPAALKRLVETGSDREALMGAGEQPHSFCGHATLEASLDLSSLPKVSYALRIECDKIIGDAYLLECEYIDLSGAVRERSFFALRTLGWDGGSLPSRMSRPAPVELDMRFHAKVNLKFHVACETGLGFEGLRAVPLKGTSRTPIEFRTVVARFGKSVGYRPLRLTPEGVSRWGGVAAQARYRLDEPDIAGRLQIRADRSSTLLHYDFQLECDDPQVFGWRTPPLSDREGSFFGAGCERPYIPGLIFEAEAGSHARFYSDSPYHVREVLRKSSETWHTDRRDWWMGFSPFSGAHLGAARSKDLGALLAGRGMRHFFRRRFQEREMLGISLGCALPHPQMQGFSVPDNSPLFALLGRPFSNPYQDAAMLHAKGGYRFQFAFARRLDGWSLPSLWKEAQEYAQPALPLSAGAVLARNEGVEIRPNQVVATACETRNGTAVLRLLNLSSRAASVSIDLGADDPITGPGIPPHGIREFEIPC